MSTSIPVPETLADRVRAFADEIVADTDLYVVDVEVRGFKGSRVVSVYLDADEGAGVDDLAKASRQLGFVLETEEVVDGAYRLEVSSPGTDRPLSLPRQYPRHIGRDMKVTYMKGTDEVRAKGRLTGTSDDGLTLELANGDSLDIPFSGVLDARVQLPW
ncbi:MAG: ribosome maturation factor RimP [Rubricoccaceae bacterium]